ncbi:hypothetical protein ABZ864_44115 [Streptomyces sp. NPDC047082]|uniref:hypothetical protein n=1 Tax=Streptomyces sp. NPDC047082 TaxID=3155259 RepID=UPI00340347F6
MPSRSGSGLCGFFTVIIGFAIFSMIWDVAVNTWGLDHTVVLALFLVTPIIVMAVVQWVRESAWLDFTAWWYEKRRARRAKER